MRNQLQKYRKIKGLKQHELAELCGTSSPQIQRLEKGERKLTVEWATKLAPYLDVSPANLLFEADELLVAKEITEGSSVDIDIASQRLPIVGKIEAGNYREAIEIPQEDWGYVTVPVDDRYPGVKRFCLEVHGNSMNLEFAPGSLVVCVDIREIEGETESGSIYVVDHTHTNGEIETTLKELRIEPDGKRYLWPRSSDPAHQQPIEMNGGSEDEIIKLRAKVTGSYSVR